AGAAQQRPDADVVGIDRENDVPVARHDPTPHLEPPAELEYNYTSEMGHARIALKRFFKSASLMGFEMKSCILALSGYSSAKSGLGIGEDLGYERCRGTRHAVAIPRADRSETRPSADSSAATRRDGFSRPRGAQQRGGHLRLPSEEGRS